jgi:polar amino acid transport system substrate-binding protein
MATIPRAYLLFAMQVLIVLSGAASAESPFPHFRHIDAGATVPTETLNGPVKLLADEDFEPFSYKDTQGNLVGIAVDVARKACLEAKVQCEINALPFVDLLAALQRSEGDAIISGLRPSAAVSQNTLMTRPYFFTTARFLTRSGMPFDNARIRTLAGKRLGFVKGTSHQAFLEKYYDRSALTPLATESELFESLRTGKLDAAFTDAVHASFWLKGSSSRNCCVTIGGGFVDHESFSRGLSIFVRQDNEPLREILDFALDRLEEKGDTAKILEHYLTLSPF